jgi:NADPH:quinone reductase-like Zn-dependent oxidoreductase
MKAAFIAKYGGPEVLQIGEQPMPTVGDDEMLVRVHAASINHVDYKIRGGLLKLIIRYAMPLTLGQDCAGVVTAVGRDVRRFKVGDEIYVRLSRDRLVR